MERRARSLETRQEAEMYDLRNIDLYTTLVKDRQAEMLAESRTHTLLKGDRPAGTRRRALLVLLGVAVLIAIAVIATVFPSLSVPSYSGAALLVAVTAIATGAHFFA